MTTTTIKVIPYRKYFNEKTGQSASRFSAYPGPDFKLVTAGYTWEVTDFNGCTTQGLCRQPVKTESEAETIALQYAEATGASVIQ